MIFPLEVGTKCECRSDFRSFEENISCSPEKFRLEMPSFKAVVAEWDFLQMTRNRYSEIS